MIYIYSIKEEKIIFSQNVETEKEIFLDFFSLKLIQNEKIIISDGDKKIVVYFNEIFVSNNFEYVVVDNKNQINLIDNIFGIYNSFNRLIENNFLLYLSELYKDIKINFNLNILFYVRKFMLIILMLVVISQQKSITIDKIDNQAKVIEKRNLYFWLEKIANSAKLEEKLTENKISPAKIADNLPHKIIASRKKRINHNKIINNKEYNDEEIKYFIQFKK